MKVSPLLALLALSSLLLTPSRGADAPAAPWQVGTPIVAYWGGPGYPGALELNDSSATQLAEGGWNLAWCDETNLDVLSRHGLRGLFHHPLLTPAALDNPEQRAALDALIERVRHHPALYAYSLTDEPPAEQFPALGRLVAYLRERDPAHLAFINLLPTYANNAQLGIPGEKVPAYREHLRQFVEVVRPGLLSYDHYQFGNGGDGGEYFLNLSLMRERAQAAGLPFLNIVQASNWVPNSSASPSAPRVPNGDEMRYLVYTSLAYGAQGIAYYVYYYPKHEGGIVLADGTPTPLYAALKTLNREFVAIARELQPLKSLGVYHAGMQPPGVTPLPAEFAVKLDPPVPAMDYHPGDRVQGVTISAFGPTGEGSATPTEALIVNLDYKAERTIGLTAPSPFEVFDATTGQWSPASTNHLDLKLAGGAGKLLRWHPK